MGAPLFNSNTEEISRNSERLVPMVFDMKWLTLVSVEMETYGAFAYLAAEVTGI
jgi:hypothetical protein